MIIRELEEKDLLHLAKLYELFWGEETNLQKMREVFFKLQKKDSHILFGAFVQEKLAGSVMGVVCEELYGECRPFLVLENMIVDENFQRMGVGTRLLYELEVRAKEKNCWQIILVTDKDRTDACNFYEKNGFATSNAGYKKKL